MCLEQYSMAFPLEFNQSCPLLKSLSVIFLIKIDVRYGKTNSQTSFNLIDQVIFVLGGSQMGKDYSS